MASTPEGKVKDYVKKCFRELGFNGISIYYHMPVQNGMGAPTLDFIGCMRGRFFAIEAKAPGKKPTERQLATIEEMEQAGAEVFVFDGTDKVSFHEWLLHLSR